MEPIVLMQTKWSGTLYVPLYLFFGGLASGMFIVAAVADLVGIKVERFARLSRVVAIAAIPILALAGFFLTSHLGKPERGFAFPVFFTNYESWMTRGGWVVGSAAPFIVAYAALWWFGVLPGIRRTLAVVGIPFGAGMAMYTGALLGGAGFVPLWSMKYLPLLFLNSGLTTGVAAAGFTAALVWPWLKEPRDNARPVIAWLSVALIVMIGLELLELYAFMTYLASEPGGKLTASPTGVFVAPTGSRKAYEYVTQGALAPWFWGGIIGVGLLVPLALTVPEFLLRRWAVTIATVKFVMVLIGGFMLRWVIVHGGDLKAPLPFPPQTWPVPGAPPIPGLGG